MAVNKKKQCFYINILINLTMPSSQSDECHRCSQPNSFSNESAPKELHLQVGSLCCNAHKASATPNPIFKPENKPQLNHRSLETFNWLKIISIPPTQYSYKFNPCLHHKVMNGIVVPSQILFPMRVLPRSFISKWVHFAAILAKQTPPPTPSLNLKTTRSTAMLEITG